MPIKGAVIKKTGTLSVTGGTDITYSEDTPVNGATAVVNAAGTDFRTRETMTFRARRPSYDAKAKVYSKDKKSVVIQFPKILANGETVLNLVRIEREVHPESTAAEAAELNIQAAQVLFDTDYTNFWSAGAMS